VLLDFDDDDDDAATDDFLDDIGDTELVFRRLLFLCKTTLSGDGSKKRSATLGDSVSLGRFYKLVSVVIYNCKL
jgi:hypothetical protein